MSVALASYNGAQHILEQLESIAAQTHLPDEIVVADDASTDETIAIVEAFAARSPVPVKLVRHERNVGIFENFYSSFAGCSGDIIFYCDQDDVWLARKVETVMAAFAPEVMMVTHQSEITDGALRPTGAVEPGNPRYGRLSAPVDATMVHAFGHQATFRRPVLNLMQQLHALDTPLSRSLTRVFDPLIPFCASLLGDIVVLPDPLTRFRRHERATSGAGIPVATVETRRSKVARLTEGEKEASAMRIALIDAAVEHGFVAVERVAALRRAYARKQALAARQRRMLAASPVERLIHSVPALTAALRGAGFTNDRPARALAMTLLAVVPPAIAR